MSKIMNVLALTSLPVVVAGGVSLLVTPIRNGIVKKVVYNSNEYKQQAEELDQANKTIESQQQEITELTLSLGSYKTEIDKIRLELSQSNEKRKQLYYKLNNVYAKIETLYDEYNLSLPEGEELAEIRDEQINQKCTAIADYIAKLTEQLTNYEKPAELSAGLYETGTTTLTKSWEQLLADGDITFTDGLLSVVNKELAGDLVCGSVEGLTSLSDAFRNCSSLTSVNLSALDTKNVTDMSGMFYMCGALTTIDIGSINTSNVTNMSNMFDHCESLTLIDIRSFDTSKVSDMSAMFSECKKVTNINLGNFDTSKVRNMTFMFNNCNELTTIHFSGTIEEWIAKNITNSTTKIKEDGSVIVYYNYGNYTITASTAE